MANGADDERFQEFPTVSPQNRFVSSSLAEPGQGFRQRQINRQFANEIRRISQDRRLFGTRRRAAIALAVANRNAPRSPTAVNRPQVNESIRLLQDAVNNPRLTGGARRALIAGAAELADRPDIAEDLTLGGLRGTGSVRVRGRSGRRAGVAPAGGLESGGLDPVEQAGLGLRQIQTQGRPLTNQLNLLNQGEFEAEEDQSLDDLFNYDPELF